MAKNERGENAYDFSEISDETRSAIALSYEAVKGHQDALPEEVVTFYKSAAEQLDLDTEPDESKTDDDDDDKKKGKPEDTKETEVTKSVEIVKAAMPGVIEAAQRAAIEPFKVQVEKAEKRIGELEDRLEREEMVETAKSITPNGDAPSEEKVSQLITIRKSMTDEQWKGYLEEQRGLTAQLKEAVLFQRQSSPQAVVTGSATEELNTIARSIMEKSEVKDWSKALDAAIDQNPVLYEKSRQEQIRQAKDAEPVS